jgi:hypothetical protein
VSVYDLISALRPELEPSAGKRALVRVLCRLAVRTSPLVLTLSDRSRQDLVALLGAPEAKVRVTLAHGAKRAATYSWEAAAASTYRAYREVVGP